MLRNFFKITLRNFSRNRSYVLINLVGLGLSLACCIVGYLNWNFAADFDKNHLNHERIYKIHSYKSVQGEQIRYGITPIALGAQIRDKVPGIAHSSRFEWVRYTIKKDQNVLEKTVAFGEPGYFEMFTYPFKFGDKSALQDKSKIILSESMAETYFGDDNPMDKAMTLIDNEGREYTLIVGGVLEKIPMNTSMNFSAITHYDNYLTYSNRKSDEWKVNNAATFVMTDGEQYPQSLVDYINANSVEIQNKARNDFQIAGYYLEPLTTLAKNSQKLRSNWLNRTPPSSAIIGPVIMAIQLLLIACFNFTNTSIAVSSRRLKEIGIRKVMGSQRKQLIVQFMGENLMLCFGALVVGLIIADALVPAYSAVWDFIDLELNFNSNPEIYLFLAGLLIITALVAGAYPALYISKYQPVKILRGNLKLGGSSRISKFLLGAQYMITALALISALSFYANSQYQSAFDLGFSKDKAISVNVENQSQLTVFKPIVERMPEITSFASTHNRVRNWHYTRTFKNGDREIESDMLFFSREYFDFMDFKMVEGRFFDPEMKSFDSENSVIVNEQMVKEFGWDKPIGEVVRIDDSTRLTVVGVVGDFYGEGFFDKVEPTGIRLSAKEDDHHFLMIKSNTDLVALYEKLEAEWLKLNPNSPFDADYDDSNRSAEEVNANIMYMFQFLGLVAFVLSTIGLYTLVSLNIIKRMKEIGVRKVLGATVNQIILLLNTEFFWLLLISSAIGAVGSYFALNALMGSIFEVYQATTISIVLLPVFALVIAAFSIASLKILSIALKNPVTSLRYE